MTAKPHPLELITKMVSLVQALKHLALELTLVNYSSFAFRRAVFFILFNPIFWNTFGRLEYRYKLLTRLFGGNNRLACYVFAVIVFTLGIIRDECFRQALEQQRIISILSPKLCNTTASTVKYIIPLLFSVCICCGCSIGHGHILSIGHYWHLSG